MTVDEIEAAALGLAPAERLRVAERLLASIAGPNDMEADDPILGIGTNPVAIDVKDGSERHDEYLYGPENR